MAFAGKVVIVTGSSAGIGAATAIAYAKEGADVVVTGRNVNNLNKISERVSKVGKAPLVVKADVSDEAEARSVIDQTIQKYGKIDVLVNNAGLLRSETLDGPKQMEVYDLTFKTNLRSVVYLTNITVPHLIKSKGNIVNISSMAATSTMRRFTDKGFSIYNTSKAALNHFSRYCAMELAVHGIRVNIVSPGPVATDILDTAGVNSDWEEHAKTTALKIVTQSEECADLILYVSSDKSRSITGSEFVIDAGFLIY